MSVIQSNQMGKGEQNMPDLGQDQTIDASLGLGGEDINWQTSPDLTSQEEKDVSVFDGYGNPTTPYSTSRRYINRRKISMHAIFYTQRDEYDAAWFVGRKDDPTVTNEGNEIQFTQSLAGFDTDNQNKGVPTMQIYLFGLRDWEQILRPNDYCAVRVWEAYPDSPDEINGNTADTSNFPDDVDGIRKRTLMVGLISSIQMNEDPNSSARVYTITCQGMQKVLADINLGLPKTAQWNDVNLLYDINGASNPLNEKFPTYSKGAMNAPSSSSKSGGGGSFGLSGVAAQIASYFSGKGCTKKQVAAIIGNAQDESGLNPSEGNGGLFQFNHGSLAGNGAHGVSVAKQCAAISGNGIGLSAWKSKTSNSSVADAASTWGSEIEGGIAGQRVEYAEQWYSKMH